MSTYHIDHDQTAASLANLDTLLIHACPEKLLIELWLLLAMSELKVYASTQSNLS